MQGLFLVFLFIMGSCIGSFLCCAARRLHLRALDGLKAGRGARKLNVRAKSSSKTKTRNKTKTGKLPNGSRAKSKALGERSVCLKCHYQLKWYDNIPIVSWVFLRGRCRKCGEEIGIAEIVSEIGFGLAFMALGFTLNISAATAFDWGVFMAVLLFGICLAFLAIYDGLYGELPTRYLIVAIVLGAGVFVAKLIALLNIRPFELGIFLNLVASVMVLGGLYLLLYLISKGKWVGDGDWLLGTAVGLALASPWLAIIALCIANTLAFVYALPKIRKLKNFRIHFGPFMVAAFFIVYAFSDFLFRFI